jgi:hypothetical protein
VSDAQSIMSDAVIYHIAHFTFREDGITECKQPKSMCLEWSPMAQRPYIIALVYIQPFVIYEIHADGRQLRMGWFGLDYVKLGYVRLGTRMRTALSLMELSQLHFSSSSDHDLCITDCRKLRTISLQYSSMA